MQFHERLKEYRKKMGLTQEELAQNIHVSRSAVAKWENGLGLPSDDSLDAIAVFFGVDREQLLADRETESIIVEKNGKLSRQKMCLIGLIVLAGVFLIVSAIILGIFLTRRNHNDIDGDSLPGLEDTSSDTDTVFSITDIQRFSSMQKQADKIDIDFDNGQGSTIPISITDDEEVAEIMDVIFKASLYKLSDPIPPSNHTRITIYQGNRSYTFSVCYISENGKDYRFSISLLEKIIDIAGAHGAYRPLSDLYPWINELDVEEIVRVRYEHAYIGVAPGMLKDISYSTNRVDIENTYRLLSLRVIAISDEQGQITGGSYTKYDFFTADETYSIAVSIDIVRIDGRYYQIAGSFYYGFENPDRNCYSFDTYIPGSDKYEIYTYEEEPVKVGDYVGFGEFEFCVYDGLLERAPRFYLRSSVAVNLLILSPDLFIIEYDNNTVIYQITGEKNFSALFPESDE